MFIHDNVLPSSSDRGDSGIESPSDPAVDTPSCPLLQAIAFEEAVNAVVGASTVVA